MRMNVFWGVRTWVSKKRGSFIVHDFFLLGVNGGRSVNVCMEKKVPLRSHWMGRDNHYVYTNFLCNVGSRAEVVDSISYHGNKFFDSM